MHMINWGRTSVGLLLCYSLCTVAQPSHLHLDSGTQKNHLLELYSSQGCSSCPPAEQWISRFTSDQRLWKTIVPMVFHVDYWDDLGWPDPFAKAQYTFRQRHYQQQGSITGVYTPGFILNGREWRQWFSKKRLSYEQLTRFKRESAPSLVADIVQSEITAHIEGNYQQSLVLNVAVLGFDLLTSIVKGENRGLQLSQDFVVLDHYQYTSKQPAWQVTLPSKNYPRKTAVVLWVTKASQLAPLQTVGGWWP